jgi:hypothetical protein
MQNGYHIYNLDNASEAAKPVLEEVKRHYQFIPNALGAMAESPEAVRAYLMLDEAKMGEVDGQIIHALREGRPLSDPALTSLQAFTAKLVQTGGNVSEQEIEQFLAAGYTRRHILDIITMIANKLIAIFANRIMGTDLDKALLPAKWECVAYGKVAEIVNWGQSEDSIIHLDASEFYSDPNFRPIFHFHA